ncbi:MAG: hypothetical protein LBM74_03530 [Oscillospiraceae bacterium]|jgi:hypothetical protein|nr:hypothetical protein [Oscillospiraceae bacterium]
MSTRRTPDKKTLRSRMIGYVFLLIAIMLLARSIGVLMSTPLYGTYASSARDHVLTFGNNEEITITLGQHTFVGSYTLKDDQMTITGVYDGQQVEEVITITDIRTGSFRLNGAIYIKQ